MKEKVYIDKLEEKNKELYEKGKHNLETGEYDKAEKLFRRFLEDVDEFPPVYNKLAIKCIYCGDFEKARELLHKALEIDEEFAPAITNLGSLEKKKGNLEKAKEFYEKAIEIDEKYGPAYNNLGVIYREKGEYGKSVKNLKRARKLNSYAVKLKSNKPFYREKGCIVPLIIFAVIIVIFYLWLI